MEAEREEEKKRKKEAVKEEKRKQHEAVSISYLPLHLYFVDNL
jgi:hypothetical protein